MNFVYEYILYARHIYLCRCFLLLLSLAVESTNTL